MPDSDENRRLEEKSGVDHPQWDFKKCLKCGSLVEYVKCRYACPRCGFVIDCSDVFEA